MATKVNFLRARTCVAVVAADSDLPKTADAIYIGVEGTIIVTDDDGIITTVNMLAGGIWPCVTVRIAAASTATGIVALFE